MVDTTHPTHARPHVCSLDFWQDYIDALRRKRVAPSDQAAIPLADLSDVSTASPHLRCPRGAHLSYAIATLYALSPSGRVVSRP